MANLQSDQLLQMETTCGSLLYELQLIWDEVGESDTDRDKMLLELEQECLEVYRRKVDVANRSRAQLRQAIADSEAELAAICSAMGERPLHINQPTQNTGSLKEELKAIIPQLEDMRKKRKERLNQFVEIVDQIRKISNEIRPTEFNSSKLAVDDTDLSIRRLEELQMDLQTLQKEKSERLKKVLEKTSILHSLCLVLGLDFKQTVSEVHPSLDESEVPKNISNDTIERLTCAIEKLREVKIQRMQKLQDLATTMLELWNLMDTPLEEQQVFQNVTSNIAASEDEIIEPNTLSLDFINYVETEVLRLEEMKHSKMKELVLKKKTELEELRRRTHLVAEAEIEVESAIESGTVDPSLILEQIEEQISLVKEESFSRKDILERVDKWRFACDEEAWLEEYNRDENRYAAGRGAHLTLKRAEKARAIVNKIPAMVETLSSKITAWENEKGQDFTYDGLHLLAMLEDYIILRQEKEQERKRQRDQKKLLGQLNTEKELMFGSKPSPSKAQSAKKMPRHSMGGSNRRLTLGGGAVMHPPKTELPHSAKPTRSTKKADNRGVLSPASRGLDVAGLPIKKLSFNPPKESESETPRKPFAILPVNHLTRTPSQIINTQFEDDIKTPKAAAIPVPKTPMTVSMPMQVATTPAPVSMNYEITPARKEDFVEYSFEEQRLAYYFKR